jgi:hypothetical protein
MFAEANTIPIGTILEDAKLDEESFAAKYTGAYLHKFREAPPSVGSGSVCKTVRISDPSPGLPTVYVLDPSVNELGRGEDNHIRLSPHDVSRKHARIVFREGVYAIEDLGSTLGTSVNGERLVAGKPRALVPKDLIGIAENVIMEFLTPAGLRALMTRYARSGRRRGSAL